MRRLRKGPFFYVFVSCIIFFISTPDQISSNLNTETVNLTEQEKERILNITDKEKFDSFISMLRRHARLKQAKITHK